MTDTGLARLESMNLEAFSNQLGRLIQETQSILDRLGSGSLSPRKALEEIDNLSKRSQRTLQATTLTLSHLFSNLPFELQIKIFELAIAGYNSNMFTLTRVCRRWREIIITVPFFWRHLTLNRKATQEWVDIWLHRAGGFLSSIQIFYYGPFPQLPDVFRNVAPDVWSRLDWFAVESNEFCPELDTMLTEILSKLRVENLRIILDVGDLPYNLMKALYDMDASRLHYLSLHAVYETKLACLSLPRLTTLEILGDVRIDDLLAFMERHSQIEKLILKCREHNPENVDVSKRIVILADLHWLFLSGRWEKDGFCRSILFPNLEELIFGDAIGCNGWVEVIASQRLVRLETVTIRGDAASPSTLIDLLRHAVAVRDLTLNFSIIYGNSDEESAVITALSERVPAGDVHDLPGSLCCPRLQHLSLASRNDNIVPPLVQLVKARLLRATLPSAIDPRPAVSNYQSKGETLPLPIISVDLKVFREIEPDSLAWLKANVEQFSCAVL